LERGSIYFLYRPKVGLEKVQGLDDVQRLFLVLSPHDSTKPKRMLVIGKKKLPDTDTHKRHWGFVDAISSNLDEILKDYLGEIEYQTPVTHQKRHLKEARLFAIGMYAFVKHSSHTHLVYFVELPEEMSEVQKAFHLENQGSFIVKIKNPNFYDNKVDISSEVKEIIDKLGTRRFGDLDYELKYLNNKGLEFILIGASSDPVTEFGRIGEELEGMEKEEVRKLLPQNKIFEQLRLDKQTLSLDPLITGKWE
jgi:hypothetical protein